MERVDDSDPRITYTPADAWVVGGVSDEWNSTTRGSKSGRASLSFQFSVYNSTCNMNIEGKSISVYGTLSGNQSTVNPIDLFVLDGGAPVTFAPGLNGTWLHHQRLYSSPMLKDGPHTLVMNHTVDNSDVFIDYFDITPSDPNATTSQSNPLSTSESGTGTEGLSYGAIAGIAIAISLVLLGCLGLLVWLLRSRRKAVNGTGTADARNRPFLDATAPSMTAARSQNATMPDSDWPRSGSTAGTSGANTQKGPAFRIMNDTGEAGPSTLSSLHLIRTHAIRERTGVILHSVPRQLFSLIGETPNI
ncbi:hypothetical protein WG66_011654 [Moniliophthora roreri]|nr:hypothetical protein WG66_011654 [Moniliophthora roreri]